MQKLLACELMLVTLRKLSASKCWIPCLNDLSHPTIAENNRGLFTCIQQTFTPQLKS